MPYAVKRDSDQWTVINTDTQKVKAHHDTEDEAQRQVKLLHMIEKGEG